MNESIIIILASAVFAGIGIFIGMYISRLKHSSETGKLETQISMFLANEKKAEANFAQATSEREQLRKEKEFLNMDLTRRNSEFESLEKRNREQKLEVEKLEERFKKEFENLANKILDENSSKFSIQNKESLAIILNPLQEKIKNFERRVEDTHKESIDRHAMLRQQIIGLKELNQQMSKDTTNLTKALRGDNKVQGNWGELVLERVLEKSGLRKDQEYFVQSSFTNEEGRRMMPDVVIHLPANRKMVIDSKVSLIHYEAFVNCEDEEEQKGFLKLHIASIKRHIDQLGAKNYHSLYSIDSPDFVLLFIPIEPAFAVAVNHDNNLYNWAFDRNIVIVTPTTLLATLRTVDSMWTSEKQQQHALDIARQAGALYDSFVNLTDDLLKIERQFGTVQGSFNTAMKKLTGRGNLVTRVERLKILGAKANKQIDAGLLLEDSLEEDSFLDTRE